MIYSHSGLLDSIEITPNVPPIGTVIWLHGLGADGNDFVPICQELNLPKDLPLRFIFPHAPEQAVTINQGYVMRAWYDIISLEVDKHADEKGILKSVAEIGQLIEQEEKKGIPTDKIVLAGFSQGALIALATGLTYAKPLAGIIALSGYLPNAKNWLKTISTVNQITPIFLGHGKEDSIVPFFLGEFLNDALKQCRHPVSWHAYDMPHSVCLEEIHDIANWLIQVFKKG